MKVLFSARNDGTEIVYNDRRPVPPENLARRLAELAAIDRRCQEAADRGDRAEFDRLRREYQTLAQSDDG